MGDTFPFLEHDFHVAGIVEHGKGARIFLPLATLQDLSGAPDKASIFFLKCTRPDHTDAVMEHMHAILPGYEIRPLKDFFSLMTSTTPLPGLNAFIDSMIALAVAIGFLVIFLSMYTTVIERTRDIGVLKSIGASKVYIVRGLLSETICNFCGGNRPRLRHELSCSRSVSLRLSHSHHPDYPRLDDPRGVDRRSSAACWELLIRRGSPAVKT